MGCGFGGLAAARALAVAEVDVTIIDRRNHHVFQPLLYQVATAGLNPSDIAQPIRFILRRQSNARVLLADVTSVDLAERRVETSVGPVAYDVLVVATGATHSYFGNDEWAADAPGLKTVEDALEIRRRLLLAFERAESTTDEDERRRQMTFVVVGGGPTGVELAGAVQEIATRTLRPDFRTIDTTDARVVLVEAGPRVLSQYPEKLSASAARQLEGLGVEVRLEAPVTAIDRHGVTTEHGVIPAATVLWGAGVQASPLGATLGVETDRAGRVCVAPDLSVPGHPEVFVIGDLAAASDDDGTPVPGVAPAAQQGGRHVAACITADLAGRERPPFRYRDRGSLATIGRSAAVVDLSPRIRFGGFAAWFLWWLVHIWSLVGFRSRVRAFAGWGWQYLFGRRTARLITDTGPPGPPR